MVEHVTIEVAFVGTVPAVGSIGVGIETGAITLFYTPIPAITNSFAIRACSSNYIGRIAGYIKFFGLPMMPIWTVDEILLVLLVLRFREQHKTTP